MYLVLSIASIVSVFPLYYMFCASTNKSVDVIAGKLIPGTYLIENYKALIANQNLGLALWNSFRNATVLTVLCLLICSIAGYGFEIYHDKGKDVVFTILLTAMMIPFAVVMIPQYVMFTKMGWTNSLLPLIIPGLFGNVSIVFFLRQNLTSIPDTLVEAAKIDGCGYFKMYYKIFLPLMKGALMTQIILWFMGIWNDYLAPTIFIQDEQWFTLQVVIRSFNAYYAVNSDYPLIMAASVLAILPTLLLFFQRYIIESMAVTGVKG